MKRHKLAWLLAAGVASLLVAACGGNSSDYGTPAVVAPPFVPGAGIAPPRFAYVVNSTSDNVSGFTVNATTGVLTPITGTGSPWTTGTTPTSMSVDAGVQFAYVVNSGSNNISTFSIGAAGALTAVGGALPATGAVPKGVAVDPLGRYVYVANSGDNTISAFARNSSTGLLTPLANSPYASGGTAPSAITIDPTGTFVYVANFGVGGSIPGSITVFSIDTASATAGDLVPVSSSTISTNVSSPASIAIAPSGAYAYVANYGNDSVAVFDVNTTTGRLTYKTLVSRTGSTPTAVVVEPNGKYAYVANLAPGTNNNVGDVSAYQITQTGSATLRGSLTAVSGSGAVSLLSTTGAAPYSVSADPSGTFVYAVQQAGGVLNPFKIGTNGGLTALSTVTTEAGTTSGAIFILITK
jgi:YVTN family beta-propeller protein